MSINSDDQNKETNVFLKMSEQQRLFFAKRRVFARMNAVIGGQPVQQGKLKRLDLTKEQFQWKNGLYTVDLNAIKIEKIRWPQKQRLILDYDIKKTLPMTYDKREYNKDAVFLAGVLKKGVTKTVLHSDQTMKMIALVAMICALVAFAAAMYAWSNPEGVIQLRNKASGKATTPTAFDVGIPAQMEAV